MPRVLIVEDSPTQARHLAFILEDAGFEVETAPDAERSFERLAAGHFDLVLSDLLLPGGSGFDLCRRIKMDPRLRQVPVIVHTSQADPVNVLRGLEAGADGFMTKDREPNEIVGRIRRTLARCTQPAAAKQSGRTRVVFLGGEFELSARQEQLADVLLSAFEDVLYLEERRQQSESALREANARLQATNRELQESRDCLDEFFQIATSLQDPNNVERTCDLVLRFCRTRGYDLAMLSLVDKEHRVVRAVRALGDMAEIIGKTVRPLDGDDILAVVVREGHPAVIVDSPHDSRCDRVAAAAVGIRGQIVLPLVSGEVIGTLQLASREPLQPSPEEMRTLETLASQAARALSGLMRMEEIRRLNRELEERNQQLQKLATELAATALAERQANEALKKAELQLVQSEKLAALGQMVAGVAHEINNPLAFVGNNLAVLQRDVGYLRELLTLYREGESSLTEHRAGLLTRIHELAEHIDLTYTLDNLDGLMGRSKDGLRRIQQIVKDLRDFARLDDTDLQEVDLNQALTTTILIARNLAKKQQVELEAKLGPLPRLTCYPAKINQVVLNLVANAVDACKAGDQVTLETCCGNPGVEIHVTDTGCGIDPAIRDKIFDPFFTTKPPGKGTGLGLSISYGIVQAHGGKIECESVPNQGTRFRVCLPLAPPPGEPAAAESPLGNPPAARVSVKHG